VGACVLPDDQPRPPADRDTRRESLRAETFVEGLRRRLPPDRDLAEIPRAQRRPKPRPLSEYSRTDRDRDEAIAAAYASGGYTLKEVGTFFGLHYAQVSRIARSVRDAKRNT